MSMGDINVGFSEVLSLAFLSLVGVTLQHAGQYIEHEAGMYLHIQLSGVWTAAWRARGKGSYLSLSNDLPKTSLDICDAVIPRSSC